jgi:septal ring factor EnvC (AmiA/AmiB activator)
MANELTLVKNMDKSKALATFEKKDAVQEIIDGIRKEVCSIVPDASTAAGRKNIASLSHKVARSKTKLDNMGKSLVEGIKQQAKVIDASRKLARDQLDELKAEVRQPLTDWEDAEKERIKNLEFRLAGITAFSRMHYLDGSETLREALEELKSIKADESWNEYEAKAATEKCKSLDALNSLLDQAEKHEAQQAELKRLRKEAAEREAAERKAKEDRERQEREALLKKEAEEKARAEERAAAELKAQKERQKIEEERRVREAEKAEQSRQIEEAKRKAAEAELKAQQAVETERQRIAEEEKRKKLDFEIRAADFEHKKKVKSEALEDILGSGVDSKTAREVLLLIDNGFVRHVSINY